MSRTSEQSRLWAPQHWPTWSGLGLFWLCARFLTWPERQRLARVIAWIVFHVVRLRRHVVFVNLRLCFPEKSEREIHALALAHFEALAYGLFETTAGWWEPVDQLPTHRIVGVEHLERALAAGKGVVLLTAHFTTLEICGVYLTARIPVGCLYREPNNPIVAVPMRRHRERVASIAVHFDDLKGLIRAFRAGHAIWYAPDQGKRTPGSEILPFFGVPAITNTATAKIAKMTGAPVVPYFARREPDASYTLTIHPPLENYPTDDLSADAVRINRLIEDNIRLAPEQYFWVHRRFKARGEGYPEVY
ncbi:MAG: Kdo2-lipid lauroyltransferase/acyltransferase [Verrucomicrobiota bacterium]|nr:Kdo2-lipid lauroyltransferase/acyltransferase [Verrucomicrobiota bacterium]